jgi:hypothetical protein
VRVCHTQQCKTHRSGVVVLDPRLVINPDPGHQTILVLQLRLHLLLHLQLQQVLLPLPLALALLLLALLLLLPLKLLQALEPLLVAQPLPFQPTQLRLQQNTTHQGSTVRDEKKHKRPLLTMSKRPLTPDP